MANAKPNDPAKKSPARKNSPAVEKTTDTSKNKPSNRVVDFGNGMKRIDR